MRISEAKHCSLSEKSAGCRLEELAAPYHILKSKGYDVTIASIKGGKIPLDPTSMKSENIVGHAQTFLDSSERPWLSHAPSKLLHN